MIGREIAHYKILDRLGGGGMGVVYKAEDTRLGRTVALKFLSLELISNESTRKRFLHEARAASLIDHPNVCHVYEVGETEDGRAYMAMSYCEGRSLREVINAGPVAPREAFSIAFAIAQGLWAAHRRGIVHRDIKPANVLLSDDGYVRIVDFGLALLVGHSRVTTSGVTVGTVAYMSPEQTSDSEVAANTDIWSLGVTLYEMMTGKLPFRGEINAALVYSIVHEPHTPLLEVNSSVPPECARIVDRCLEKDPAKRYQTIEELLEDMVNVARELNWESSIASSTIAPILSDRRRRLWTKRIVLGASAAVVSAAGIWVYYTFRPAPSPYTTSLRVAVMPLDNMIGADQTNLVDGISEHLSRTARWVNPGPDGSMWMVPFNTVLKADLPNVTDAARAFGANRALTGNVQRFGDAYRINLSLVDTRTGRQLATAAVPYSVERMHALPETLMVATAHLLGVNVPTRTSPWRCTVAQAASAYFETMPMLRKSDDEVATKTAVEMLDAAASMDPSFAALLCADGSARLQLARRTRDASMLASAVECGHKARSLAPRLTEASLLIGDAFARSQAPDSAESWYRRGASVEPGFSGLARQLARFYVDQKRVDEAEEVYRQVISIHPDLAVAHRDLGNFFFERDRLDEAAQEYRETLALAPAEAIALNNLGAVLHRQGNWPVAHDMFLRAFKTRPDCFSSSNVAVTLYFQRKFAESAKYYEFALAHCDTTTHTPWGNLARALYWAPNGRDRAMIYYRKALVLARARLDQNPDDVDMMANVIDYEAMTGNESDARALIDRIKPVLDDNDRAMYRVGTVYEKLGQRDAALDIIGNAVRHGFPLSEIKGDPMLADFVTDPVFLAMVRNEEAAEEAQAAETKP